MEIQMRMKETHLKEMAQILYPNGFTIENTGTHFKIFGVTKNGRECLGIKIDSFENYDDDEIEPFFVLDFNYEYFRKLKKLR